MSVEKVAEVLPEPLTNEGIDHGVDTAVRVGDHLGHQHGQVQLSALTWIASAYPVLSVNILDVYS